jgi:hypothetical protein
MRDFWLSLKKIDRGNSIENASFLAFLKKMDGVTPNENVKFLRKSIGVTLLKMRDFWLFLKKMDRVIPIENV